MDFPFISIWTEIKGIARPCCTNFWLLLHFALPQSGKYVSGNLLIPLLFLPVVYLADFFFLPSCSEHTDAVSVDNCVHGFSSELTGNKRSRVRSPALGINTSPR